MDIQNSHRKILNLKKILIMKLIIPKNNYVNINHNNIWTNNKLNKN
jgi:hypothetical protein